MCSDIGAGDSGPVLLLSSFRTLVWPLLLLVSNGEEVKVCRALVNLRAVWYLWEAVWGHNTHPQSRCQHSGAERATEHMVSTPAVAPGSLYWHCGMGSLRGRQELLKWGRGSCAARGREECRGAQTSRDAAVALQGHKPDMSLGLLQRPQSLC